MSLGYFTLVLHGHLPWVLHHGRWPHGEHWLFEAVSETWLPLVDVLATCRAEGHRPAFTLGLMPVLLEQLAHPRFTDGFARWLEERIARAEADRAVHGALATRYVKLYRAQLDRIGEGVLAPLVDAWDRGEVELLTSNATHAYHPLVLHDACARAQVRAGLATSARHLGRRPRGAWLPECAYRGPGHFRPAALHGDERERQGVGTLFADEGIRYFFVDHPLLADALPCGRVRRGRLEPGVAEERHGWRSPLEPHRLVEHGLTQLSVLVRSPEVSEQVWSRHVGYPGDFRYLEFHKREGMDGLRYWRVTGPVDLDHKLPYDPAAAVEAVHGHAHHFVALVKDVLRRHRDATGRKGVVCAPFDAELFGHWWSEGPRFLLEVVRRMAADPEIELRTAGEVLARKPADKAVVLREGSWGAGSDHRVWWHEGLRPAWETVYRAEDRFLDLWHRAPWRGGGPVRAWLEVAARELLLLQASDWPFVISTGGAVDYGTRRIWGHAALFDDVCNGIEDLLAGRPPDPVAAHALADARLRDDVFRDVELAWWS